MKTTFLNDTWKIIFPKVNINNLWLIYHHAGKMRQYFSGHHRGPMNSPLSREKKAERGATIVKMHEISTINYTM